MIIHSDIWVCLVWGNDGTPLWLVLRGWFYGNPVLWLCLFLVGIPFGCVLKGNPKERRAFWGFPDFKTSTSITRFGARPLLVLLRMVVKSMLHQPWKPWWKPLFGGMCRGIESFQGLVGGAGFCPSTVS